MSRPQIKLAGEGHLDLAVLRRLASDAGFSPAEEYGIKGKGFINQRLPNWNKAAHHAPWLVLRDLDRDAECAGDLVGRLLPVRSRYMCFRIAVSTVESWLLADREACVEHLGLRASDIPVSVEGAMDAKLALLQAARRARSADVRQGLVAISKQGRLAEGDTYNAILSSFVVKNWRPKKAERSSSSLRKARQRLAELALRFK
jgi:hypothetical protein